jgi:RNA polymerase sigma-70 factor (ECF subfamily)
MSQSASDEELMVAYINGDLRAFEDLYRRHAPRVYGYLRARLRDRAFADDVFQATFLKLHGARGKYDPSFPFAPWLFTVCRSVMIDALRKRKQIEEDQDPAAVEAAQAREVPAALGLSVPGLDQLSTVQRESLELRYRDELSFEEIARRLETTPTNARQIVSRAVRALKRLVSTGGER